MCALAACAGMGCALAPVVLPPTATTPAVRCESSGKTAAALKDPDWQKRLTAARCISESGGHLGVKELLAALKDDRPEVRAQAEASGCAGYFRKMDSGVDVLTAIRRTISVEDFEREKGD